MIGEDMLTRRQQTQIRTAFRMAALGNRVVFVLYHESQSQEFVGFLRSTYGDSLMRVQKKGASTEIRFQDGKGVLQIEPFRTKEQFQGREFSGAFVDEWAALDRETLDLLATRVR